MPLHARHLVRLPIAGDDSEGLHGSSCECYRRYHFTTDALPFFGFASLALFILLLCALLAGLTLAVCSLDIVWLQVMSVTGNKNQRNQALKVSRIKRHATWFLCSMIICSVACTESLPILVQSLCGTAWLPFMISVIAVAVFAELIPQYIIPRNAMFWAYYCWPFIWGCMCLTCIISWPLSFIIDRIAWPGVNRGIYTSEQLGVLIRFHELAERHGGHLGPDAGRIMRGALDFDGRLIQERDSTYPENGKASEAGSEGLNASKHAIIVPWVAVRLISIDEEVTEDFIAKVRGWAYSRLPVIGDSVVASCEASKKPETGWKGQKLYGFLHIKNLVGLELVDKNSKRLLVKDLPLYPLPVVRDDLPLYDLLNIFQLGMSRMAVVIERPVKDRLVPLSASAKNKDALPRHSAPVWSANAGLKNRNTIEMRTLDAHIGWTTDFLNAAQNDTVIPAHRKHNVIGIGCPNPIGIVTYEDVIDSLLQRTSQDEKDFFSGYTSTLHFKVKKTGDDSSSSSNRSIVKVRETIPSGITENPTTLENTGYNQSTLRLRNVSTILGNDGADDMKNIDDFALNEAESQRSVVHAQDVADGSSSYTQNSLGGFRNIFKTVDDITQPLNALECSKVTMGLPARSSAITAVEVLPSGPNISSLRPLTTVSSGRSNTLPRLRRVTSFLRAFSNFDSRPNRRPSRQEGSGIDFEKPTFVSEYREYSAASMEHFSEKPELVVPFSASAEQGDGTPSFRYDGASHLLAARLGTRLSMLPGSAPENNTLNSQPKKTVRRRFSMSSAMVLSIRSTRNLQPRIESFRDDRTSLPSQIGQGNYPSSISKVV